MVLISDDRDETVGDEERGNWRADESTGVGDSAHAQLAMGTS